MIRIVPLSNFFYSIQEKLGCVIWKTCILETLLILCANVLIIPHVISLFKHGYLHLRWLAHSNASFEWSLFTMRSHIYTCALKYYLALWYYGMDVCVCIYIQLSWQSWTFDLNKKCYQLKCKRSRIWMVLYQH